MIPGVVKYQEPADAIVSRFTVAWVEDKAIERTIRKHQVAATALGVIAIAAFFAAIAFGSLKPLALVAVAIALIVVVGRRWRAYSRLDIDDRKLQTVLRVLKILRADIPRAERVTLAVDLRDYDAAEKTPPDGGVFTDDWFRLTARLADGNVVTLMLTDRIKRKVKHRGTRFVFRSRIRVAMRLAKRYRPAAPVVARLAAGRPTGAGTGMASVTAAAESGFVVTLGTERVADPAKLPAGDALLRALAWVYGGIAATRRRTA